MTRRWIAFIAAALVLLAVLPTDAFAGGSTVVSSDLLLADIAIEVSVPAGTNTFVNPLNLPVEIDGTVEDGQIVSAPAYMENLSAVPISVGVTVSGKTKGGLIFLAVSTKNLRLTTKMAFVYFQLRVSDSPDSDAIDWGDSYRDSTDVRVLAGTMIKQNYVTLAAADQAERYGVFRLTGDCVTAPATPWTSADGFTATIAFTFKMVPLV